MKKRIIPGLLVIMIYIMASGCKNVSEKVIEENHPGIPVTVSSPRYGEMISYIELSATSQFMYKAIVKTPVTGYIENMEIIQGDAVGKNKTLFTIRTKEASALLDDSVKNLKFNGMVNVKAAIAGIISSVAHPTGDYVSEGDELCQVALPESFVFILDVPFELSRFVILNKPCEIILPDSTSLRGAIKSRFPVMTGSSQTERYVVKLTGSKRLPENLTAKVKIVKEDIKNSVSLLKSCILTDETMQSFWVMKLISDSMAVKVPVRTGITQGNYIQILQPGFNSADRFLSSGNFGLGDTAYVKVNKNSGNE
jgi:multidrug efflux pump subunit AcrA (membrane-fusion protein)